MPYEAMVDILPIVVYTEQLLLTGITAVLVVKIWRQRKRLPIGVMVSFLTASLGALASWLQQHQGEGQRELAMSLAIVVVCHLVEGGGLVATYVRTPVPEERDIQRWVEISGATWAVLVVLVSVAGVTVPAINPHIEDLTYRSGNRPIADDPCATSEVRGDPGDPQSTPVMYCYHEWKWIQIKPNSTITTTFDVKLTRGWLNTDFGIEAGGCDGAALRWQVTAIEQPKGPETTSTVIQGSDRRFTLSPQIRPQQLELTVTRTDDRACDTTVYLNLGLPQID